MTAPMTAIAFNAIPTADAEVLWAGAPDAYGLRPERRITQGDGYPCRHCLGFIGDGEPYLTLAYRPFPSLQPYAERPGRSSCTASAARATWQAKSCRQC